VTVYGAVIVVELAAGVIIREMTRAHASRAHERTDGATIDASVSERAGHLASRAFSSVLQLSITTIRGGWASSCSGSLIIRNL